MYIRINKKFFDNKIIFFTSLAKFAINNAGNGAFEEVFKIDTHPAAKHGALYFKNYYLFLILN